MKKKSFFLLMITSSFRVRTNKISNGFSFNRTHRNETFLNITQYYLLSFKEYDAMTPNQRVSKLQIIPIFYFVWIEFTLGPTLSLFSADSCEIRSGTQPRDPSLPSLVLYESPPQQEGSLRESLDTDSPYAIKSKVKSPWIFATLVPSFSFSSAGLAKFHWMTQCSL